MFVIERARGREAEDLVKLAAASVPGAVDPQHIRDEVARDACLVARDTQTEQILGFALARKEGPCEAHIVAMAVDAFHRREGVRTALLQGVKDKMVDMGAMRLRLDVRSDDDRAQAFYARHGFEPEGLQPHLYSDGSDGLSLSRPI